MFLLCFRLEMVVVVVESGLDGWMDRRDVVCLDVKEFHFLKGVTMALVREAG